MDFHDPMPPRGHIPCAEFAGVMRPGLAGRLPSKSLLDVWNKREANLFASIRDGFCLCMRSHSPRPRTWDLPASTEETAGEVWFLSGAWPHDLLKAQTVMNWLENYASANPVAYSILLISLVAVVGLGFAALKVRGIGVGVTGVLFAGLIFGHFGFHLEHHTLEFLREFGLILFVFTIGLQIGPGFFASLRDKGLALNGLAAGIVIGGGILTAIFAKFFGIPFGAAAGLFAGATTNTPSLGAAQQTLLGRSDLGPSRSLICRCLPARYRGDNRKHDSDTRSVSYRCKQRSRTI